MSVDPAHSLGDSFDLETSLFHGKTGDPCPIERPAGDSGSQHPERDQAALARDLVVRRLGAADHRHQRRRGRGTGDPAGHGRAERDDVRQPVPARAALRRHRAGLRAHGRIDAVRQHADHARMVHEAHLSVPARDRSRRCAPSPTGCRRWNCPPTTTSPTSQDLFGKLDGIGELLENPKVTSVRLVTNPEKMVLRETQRAFVYFSLHGLTVDGVIVNRVLPDEVTRRLVPGVARRRRRGSWRRSRPISRPSR